MLGLSEKRKTIEDLRKIVLDAEGFSSEVDKASLLPDLGFMLSAFPGNIFPINAVHEFVSHERADRVASAGFICCLLARLMRNRGPCVWISMHSYIFPPALKGYGIDPDRIIFIRPKGEKDALWVMEEALKCSALSAVVGEIGEVNFTASRRLQLAVEQSKVTGFLHRFQPRTHSPLACVSRWYIRQTGSYVTDNLPGVGYAQWDVTLQKIRNGYPRSWRIACIGGQFHYPEERKPAGILLLTQNAS